MIHDKSLSDTQQIVMSLVDRHGVTSPIAIRILCRMPASSVTYALRELWYKGQIKRPCKGLVMSQSWIDKHPQDVPWIEQEIGYHLDDDTI